MVNVGKYTINGWYVYWSKPISRFESLLQHCSPWSSSHTISHLPWWMAPLWQDLFIDSFLVSRKRDAINLKLVISLQGTQSNIWFMCCVSKLGSSTIQGNFGRSLYFWDICISYMYCIFFWYPNTVSYPTSLEIIIVLHLPCLLRPWLGGGQIV